MNTPWMTDTFLAQVLRSVEETQQEVKVIKFQSHPAVPPGVNYCSLLFRVHIDYELDQEGDVKSTSLIVKVPLSSGQLYDFLEKRGAYNVECMVYRELLPKMYKYKNVQSTARSYFCPLEKSLVLEDLKTSGFMMADRLKQLDFAHCRLVLERMAIMHALSVAVHRDSPELLLSGGVHLMYNDYLTGPDKEEVKYRSSKMLTALADEIEKLEGCSKYAAVIRDGIASHWDKTTELLKPSDSAFNVFNMGDVWTNNLMFKYNDDGIVVDCKFVDFQNSLFTTFVAELTYFWWSSANENVRENHREELFEVYRESLNRTLDEIGCPDHLTKDEFDRQMKSSGPYVLYVLFGVLPVALAEPDNFVEFNDLTEAEMRDSPNKKNLQSKYFKKNIAKLLQQIDKCGLLG